MKVPFWTVDAFTRSPFSGNPAAVCLLEEDLEDHQKQLIATEMNISETCYVTKDPGHSFTENEKFGLRWFTPTNEVPLCGHATLAAAAVLFKISKNKNKILKFQTLSGELKAESRGDKIVLDFPLNCPKSVDDDNTLSGLVAAATCGLHHQEVLLCPTTKKLLIRLKDGVTRAELESLSPDISLLESLERTGRVKGVILTVRSQDEAYHFLSRYFAPWNGIPEDPVTGSAHTVLAPYWGQVMRSESLVARQCSARGGDLTCTIINSNRVQIAGEAVIVVSGIINLGTN